MCINTLRGCEHGERAVLWWPLPVCPWIGVVPVCPWIGLCPGARVPGPATGPEGQKWHACRQLQFVFWFPYGRCKGRCLIWVLLTLVCGVLPVNFRMVRLLWHVEVHFDCAGSHKVYVCVLASWVFLLNILLLNINIYSTSTSFSSPLTPTSIDSAVHSRCSS